MFFIYFISDQKGVILFFLWLKKENYQKPLIYKIKNVKLNGYKNSRLTYFLKNRTFLWELLVLWELVSGCLLVIWLVWAFSFMIVLWLGLLFIYFILSLWVLAISFIWKREHNRQSDSPKIQKFLSWQKCNQKDLWYRYGFCLQWFSLVHPEHITQNTQLP